MAEWIAEGEPSLDLWEMDVRRLRRPVPLARLHPRPIQETYETYYDILYPNHERSAGRPLRISPANAWHREHDAAFGEKSGWERVNWYESNAAAGDESLRPRGWAGQHWSPAIGAEHLATREAVAIFDETSFAKMEIEGRARPTWSSACATTGSRARWARSPTPRCSTRAAGSSATSRSPGSARSGSRSSPARVRQPRPRVDPQAPARGRQRPRSTTPPQWACFGIWGPRARDVLQPLTPQDLSNEEFPYMSVREITVGNVPVRALRVTYVGELGWELYCPTEYGLGLWRRCGRRGSRTGSSPAATGRSTRCGSRRATGSGAPTSPPTRRRTRAGSASASSSTRRAASSAARRSPRRRSAARGPASAA